MLFGYVLQAVIHAFSIWAHDSCPVLQERGNGAWVDHRHVRLLAEEPALPHLLWGLSSPLKGRGVMSVLTEQSRSPLDRRGCSRSTESGGSAAHSHVPLEVKSKSINAIWYGTRWSQTGFYFRLPWCPIFLSPGFLCEKSEQIPFKGRNAAGSVKKSKEKPRSWHGVLILPHHHMCHQWASWLCN